VLGPVLFNVIIKGVEEVTGYTFIRLADSTRLGSSVNMRKGRATKMSWRSVEFHPERWLQGAK